MEIKLSKQQKITVNGAEDISLIMRQILRKENKIGQGQEHFWMVDLNQANRILYIELVALGSSQHGGHQSQRSLPHGDLQAGGSGDYGPLRIPLDITSCSRLNYHIASIVLVRCGYSDTFVASSGLWIHCKMATKRVQVMSEIDKIKEEIGWLKVVFGLLIAIDVSVIGWAVQNFNKTSITLVLC